MKKITKAYNFYEKDIKFLNTENFLEICELSIEKREYLFLNELLICLLSRKKALKYAIFATEQVIDVFQSEEPNYKRPVEQLQQIKKDSYSFFKNNFLSGFIGSIIHKEIISRRIMNVLYNATGTSCTNIAQGMYLILFSIYSKKAALYSVYSFIYACMNMRFLGKKNFKKQGKEKILKILKYGIDLLRDL